MNKLTDLYRTIHQEKIYLKDHYIESNKAVTLNLQNNYAIFVDYSKIATLSDEFNVVAHEYGHCITGSTHKLSSPFDLIEKHEYKADKYSVHEFLPIDAFKDAIDHGYTEVWQLAEYLDLPEDFIRKADYIYRCEGLLVDVII